MVLINKNLAQIVHRTVFFFESARSQRCDKIPRTRSYIF